MLCCARARAFVNVARVYVLLNVLVFSTVSVIDVIDIIVDGTRCEGVDVVAAHDSGI